MNNTTPYKDQAENVGSTMLHNATETAHEVKDKIEQKWDAAADGLNRAATAISDKAQPVTDKVSELARTASDKVSSAATYVRDTDANKMLNDVKVVVKNNPVPSMLTAVAVGFLIGRAVTSSHND